MRVIGPAQIAEHLRYRVFESIGVQKHLRDFFIRQSRFVYSAAENSRIESAAGGVVRDGFHVRSAWSIGIVGFRQDLGIADLQLWHRHYLRTLS